MLNENFEQGAFIVSRSLFDSKIWVMPPYYLKIWIWLLGKCNHETIEKHGMTFHRGECLVTLEETLRQCQYKAGFRIEKLRKDHVWRVYEWLRGEEMVHTTKTTMGMFVKVLMYNEFQSLENYERNNESNSHQTIEQQQRNNINKNEKNDKNEKKKKNIQKKISKSPSEEARLFFTDQKHREPFIQKLIEQGVGEGDARSQVKRFTQYWTELNHSGKKQRWQLQKTFEVRRRLVTWFNNYHAYESH